MVALVVIQPRFRGRDVRYHLTEPEAGPDHKVKQKQVTQPV